MADFLDRLLARAHGEEPVVTPVRRTRFERGPAAIAAWSAADASEPALPDDDPDDSGAADVPVDDAGMDDVEAAGIRRRPAPVPLAPREPAAARADLRAARPVIDADALVPRSATPRRDADRREPEPVLHDAVTRVETPQPTPRGGAKPGTADLDTARGPAPDQALDPDLEAAPDLPVVRRPVRSKRPVETGPSAADQSDGPDRSDQADRPKPAAVVQVRISRVEVRAAAPSSPSSGPPAQFHSPARPQPAAAPTSARLSLDAYLERARRRS
jgi:hypothetical protein